ncbi:hypothetical protein FGG90_03515 [Clavibacter tessellarius]|uniref:Uncharacterized protein n=1 Tax=Clavibacter tessellarius TaxID=31965 RepID=A0A225CGL7_9MICO|nr:hypothetical protein [Clavibacter michiganensis]OQJ63881.1 hypothetical protein B5P24_13195 [Clavibacter michiganensis subsp. tessellarius]UKF33141.1 hypothetical protein FGG90_03515 [Clavibacter michiganensis subsp. tessellarius]
MTPSHDAPDTGPTSFDDGPAPATLGLSRREMRAAERARAQALGIDEADDAPAEDASTTSPDGEAGAGDGAADAAGEAGSASSADASDGPSDERPAESSATPGVGPDTSAILLSGGVLTRRQLRAIREAEEAARQQRGSEHDAPAEDAADPAAPPADAPGSDAPPVADDAPDEAPAADEAPAPVDDAPPAGDTTVPPYVRYGRGSRATPRPRAPYGSAYRRAALVEDERETADEVAPEAAADAAPEAPATGSAESAADASASTPSAWPFAPITPSVGDADHDVDASGEQPTVPPLATHLPDRTEDPRPSPSLDGAAWDSAAPAPRIEPAFGTRASDAEDDDAPGAPARSDEVTSPDAAAPAAADPAAADAPAPFTPPTGHWSVQDQVDEDQPHTGNHFILPTVPHVNDMQQALNSTGEIIITGSIDLPRSLGSMGTHPDRFDTADMDRILEQGDDQDHAPGGSDSEPVRASRAVSTHTSTRAVVQPPPRKRFTAPVVAAVTAGGVAVIGAGLVIVAFMTNVF